MWCDFIGRWSHSCSISNPQIMSLVFYEILKSQNIECSPFMDRLIENIPRTGNTLTQLRTETCPGYLWLGPLPSLGKHLVYAVCFICLEATSQTWLIAISYMNYGVIVLWIKIEYMMPSSPIRFLYLQNFGFNLSLVHRWYLYKGNFSSYIILSYKIRKAEKGFLQKERKKYILGIQRRA